MLSVGDTLFLRKDGADAYVLKTDPTFNSHLQKTRGGTLRLRKKNKAARQARKTRRRKSS